MARTLPGRRYTRQPQGTAPRLKREFADAVVVYVPSVGMFRAGNRIVTVNAGSAPVPANVFNARLAQFSDPDQLAIAGTAALDFSTTGMTILAVGMYTGTGGVQPIETLVDRAGGNGGLTIALYNTFGGVPSNVWSSYTRPGSGNVNYDSFWVNGAKATTGNGDPATTANTRYACAATAIIGPDGTGGNIMIGRGSNDSQTGVEIVVIWPRRFSEQKLRQISADAYSIFEARPTQFFISATAAITVQPTNQSANAGGTATFTVTAPGALTYQWQDNRTGSFTNVAGGTGATTASYTTASALQSMQGLQYQVLVDGSPSQAAQLTVVGFPVYLYSTAVQSGNDVWLRNPSSTGNQLLQATPASYAVTEPDAALPVARVTSFAAASYAVTAPDIALTVQHPLSVSAATYVVTAPSEATIYAALLPVSLATYAVTAPAVALTVQHPLVVAAASYVVTAPDEATLHAATLPVTPATYAVTAPDIALTVQHPLSVAAASYAVSTTSASLLAAYAPGASAATYVVSAPAVALTVQHPLAVAAASYVVNVPDEATIVARLLTVTPASYVINEPDANVTKGTVYNLVVTAASYAVTALDQATIRTAILSGDAAAYGVSVPAVQLGHGLMLLASPSAVSVGVNDIALLWGHALSVAPIAYTLSEPAALLGHGTMLGVSPAAYVVTEPDAGRQIQLTFIVGPAAYALTASNVSLNNSLALVGGYSERIMSVLPENRFIPPL